MKLLHYLLALLLIPAVLAATYTDTADADFNAGTLSDVNVTSNTVILNTSSGAYVASGTFTSQAFDLGSNPAATISWNLATPAGTSILISSRSGNNTTDFSAWSSWSADYGSSGDTITSPMNRYYQYRAQLITTDNTSTPVLTDVTLTYTEANTTITHAGSNITANSSGNYNFQVFVNDTWQILNVSGRYSVSTGAFSSAVQLTTTSPATYNLTIPDPTWLSYASTNITLEVTVLKTNGSINDTYAENVTELIDFMNTAPVLDPVSNQTLTQTETMNVTVTATDVNSQALTFTTNNSGITVTSLSNTSARLIWSPNASDVGVNIVTVTVNDTYSTASRNITVNITDVNDAPTLADVAAVTGYHGIRMAITLTAYDPDADANLTFSVVPAFFSVATSDTSNATGYYYGIANFTPADPERGAHNLTFTVDDGEETASINVTMTIDYCGDNVCQASYETEATCAEDCADDTALQSIALIVPDRNCANTSMQIQTFNATERFSCYYQGLVEQGLALCSPLSSVSIAVYERNGTILTSLSSLNTDTNGLVNYTPPRAGEYKFSATKDGFANTSSIVYVRSCDQDIVIKETNVTKEQTPLPPIEEKPKEELPEEETPGDLQAEATLLQAMMFYVVVPLLLAMLLFAGSVFYDTNKDSLPWILEARIFVQEQRIKYHPQITMIREKTAPVVTPVVESLNALYAATLKPVVDKFKSKK